MMRRSAHRKLITKPLWRKWLVPVVCPIFLAVVDDPWRFPHKRKLWSYAGLGVRRRSSGAAKRAQEGGSRGGNRLLKHAAMLAAQAAMKGETRFARYVRDMVASGVDQAMAIRTAARNILAAALAIWKNGTVYRDKL